MPDSLIPAESPFKGPIPLERTDTIYGRKSAIEGLYDLICSSRIVLFHSPSGAGKTSLVQAGLLKKVERDFQVIGPERILPDGPAALLAKFRATLPQPAEEESGYSSPRLWIIDQFEEILATQISDADRDAFFLHMGQMLQDSMTFALFIIREDLLAALDPYRSRIPTQFNNRFRIDLLTVAVATDCIAKPAARAGYPFAPGAAEVIANLLGPEVEPVYLQVVCADLWRNLAAQKDRTKTQIDLDDVRDLGNINQAISTYYDRALRSIVNGNRRTESLIRDWIGEKLITASRRRNQVLESPGSSEGLDNGWIGQLVEALLVRPEPRAKAIWYELSHERLIEPVLSSNERFRATLSALERASRRWLKSDRNDRFLVTGDELAALKTNIDFDSLNPEDRAFLLACEAIEVAAIQAEHDKVRLERVSFLMAVLFGMASAVTIASYGFVATVIEAPEARLQYIYLVLGANLLGGLLAWPVYRIYVNDQRMTDLLGKLARKHRTDPSLQSISAEVALPFAQQLSEGDIGVLGKGDRQTLDFAPYWILLIIAGSDSRISASEVRALRRALRKSSFSQRQLVLDQFLQDSRPAIKGLEDAAAILAHRLDPAQSATMRKEILRIAYSLAGRDEASQKSLRFVKAIVEGESPQNLEPGMTRYYQLSGVSSTAALVQVCVVASFAAILIAFPYAWLQSMLGNNFLFLVLLLRGVMALVFGSLVGGVSLVISFFTDLRDNSVLKVLIPVVIAIALYVRWAVEFEVLWPQQWLPVIQGIFNQPGGNLAAYLGLGAAEAVLIAIPCLAAGWLSTGGVYCEGCSTWAELEQNVLLLREPPDLNAIVSALEDAKLAPLEPWIESPQYADTAEKWLALDLESCTSCKDLHVLTLLKCQAETNNKGERSFYREEVMTQLLINRRMAEWIRSHGKPA